MREHSIPDTDAEVRKIGPRLELFVDDLIEKMSGVRLRMHAPIPREIALEFNRPWEGPYRIRWS